MRLVRGRGGLPSKVAQLIDPQTDAREHGAGGPRLGDDLEALSPRVLSESTLISREILGLDEHGVAEDRDGIAVAREVPQAGELPELRFRSLAEPTLRYGVLGDELLGQHARARLVGP